MAAGTLPAGATGAATAVADPLVRISQPVFDQFSKYMFMYQWGMVLEIFILCAAFFMLRPFLPFVISRIFTHLPVLGIMTRVRNTIPTGGSTLRNGMYRKELKDNVMYYIKKYLGSYFMFGVPFDFVHIDRGFVQDPIQNKFVATLDTMGYKTVDSINNALTFNGISPEDPNLDIILMKMGFSDYPTAHSVINPSDLMYGSVIYAPKYSNIPLDALLSYGADIAPGSIAAQVSDEYEWRKPQIEPDKLGEWMPYIVLIFAMVLGGAILMSQMQ